MRYSIEYSPETEQHFSVLAMYQRNIVFDEVDRQLMYEPTVETRNRKPMRPNPVAPWELRIGMLQAYYDVVDAPEPTVVVWQLASRFTTVCTSAAKRFRYDDANH